MALADQIIGGEEMGSERVVDLNMEMLSQNCQRLGVQKIY